MRISDWSSDVCSSDLTSRLRISGSAEWLHARHTSFPGAPGTSPLPGGGNAVIVIDASGNHLLRAPTFSANAAVNYTIPVGEGSLDLNVNYSYSSKKIGRASCRERVCQYV